MRRALAGLGRTAIAVSIVGLSCGEIREDEMDCEEAEAHLAQCCPQIDTSHLSCVYQQKGCLPGSEDQPDLDRPDFTIAASNCIRTRSCEALGQACDALAQVPLDHSCQSPDIAISFPICDPTFPSYGHTYTNGEKTGLQRLIEAAACR